MTSGKEQTTCPTCKGAGHVLQETEPGAYSTRRCPVCADLLPRSGLVGDEQSAQLDQLRDLPGDVDGYHLVLRQAGQAIIAGARGFATVFATTGTAKSLWARAVTVGLCRRGLPTRYLHARDLEKALFGEGKPGGGNGEAMNVTARDVYQSIQALVVDEADKINWKNEWIASELSHLFDARYRQAGQARERDRLITVLVAQYHPRTWAPDFLMSRITDGTHAIPWPASLIPPTSLTRRPCSRPRCAGTMVYDGQVCLCDQCGAGRPLEIFWPFEIRTPDMRPTLPSGYKTGAKKGKR